MGKGRIIITRRREEGRPLRGSVVKVLRKIRPLVVCFVGFIHFIVVVEGKTSLRLGWYYQITGQRFMKGNFNTDNL